MPTLPLFRGTFFTSQSMVSHASVLSSVSFGPLPSMNGRTCWKVPSEAWRPRTSWAARMNPSFAKVSNDPLGSL